MRGKYSKRKQIAVTHANIEVPEKSLVIPEAHLQAIIFEQVTKVFEKWQENRAKEDAKGEGVRKEEMDALKRSVEKWSWICVGILVALVGTGGVNALDKVLKITGK